MNPDNQMTEEIYTHLFPFLEKPAQNRPMLGNVYLRDNRCYAADGYMLFDFPKSMIDIEDWLTEHCYEWDNKGDETATQAYTGWSDEIDDMTAIASKVTNLLPCGLPLTNEAITSKGYPNPDSVLERFTWQDLGHVSATELYTACYRQKRLWAGKGYAGINIPNTNVNLTVENLEVALNFPLFLMADDNLQLTLGTTKKEDEGFAIKLSANDTHVLIMNWLGDVSPIAEMNQQ